MLHKRIVLEESDPIAKYLFLECKKKEKKKKRVQELDKPLLVRAGRGEQVDA